MNNEEIGLTFQDPADVSGFLAELNELTRKYKLVLVSSSEDYWDGIDLRDIENNDGPEWKYWTSDRYGMVWSKEDPYKPIPAKEKNPADVIYVKWSDEAIQAPKLTAEEMAQQAQKYEAWKATQK